VIALAHTAGQWQAPPLPLATAAVASALFAQAFVRLRRRGRKDHAPWSRVVLFAAGIAAATLALVSPLDAIGEDELLSVHMTQHLLLGDVAPALLLVALRGPLLVFFVPAAVLAPVARSSAVRKTLALVTIPVVAFALWAANLAIWHVPTLYDAALSHQRVHDFEHACWLATGFLVWTLLVDPLAHRRLTTGGRLALAASMFAAGQVLMDVLVFSFTPLYPSYHGAYGLSALTDQRLAGVAMMAEQLVVLGTLALFLLSPRLRATRLVPRLTTSA
jgi:cytochrome c oxidase assembly factor CtaG